MSTTHPRFVFTLEGLPDPAAKVDPKCNRDAEYRLKLLLKHAYRTWGFRCVSVADPKPDPAAAALPRWDVDGPGVGLNDIPAPDAQAAAEAFVRWLFDMAPDAVLAEPLNEVTVFPHGRREGGERFNAQAYFEVFDVVCHLPSPEGPK